jgi:hypothetical protein
MRPTEIALHHLDTSRADVNKMDVNLKDIGNALIFLSLGCEQIAIAIGQTYDKLVQIDRKLSSTSHRRPTM